MRRFVAAGFGVGLIPRTLWGSDAGAGTFGAIVGGGIALGLVPVGVPAHIGALIAAVALSTWAPRSFLGDDDDPGWVAIDEVAGAMLAVTGLGGLAWAVAWVVARLADIFKVLPGVGAAERLPGALGVTADDLVAGAYGLAAGWLVTALL